MREKVRPYPLTESLLPYQTEDLNKIVKRKRSLIAWEPGLGKTVGALVAANYWQTQHIVIICPAVMRGTWETTYKQWSYPLLNLPVNTIYKSKKNIKLTPNTPQVIITSYQLAITTLLPYIEIMLSQPNSLLIVDEFHNLRHWKAKRTKVIAKQFATKATYLLGLTGTPMLNSIIELHPQFSMIDPNKWGTLKQFGDTFSTPVQSRWHRGVEYKGTRNLDILKERYKPFLFRRNQEKELTSLPPLHIQSINIAIDPKLAAETLEFTRIVETNEGNKELPNSISQLRHKLGKAKLKAAKEWIADWLETNEKEPLVIFTYHRDILEELTKYIQTYQLTYGIIQGGTTNVNEITAKFQAGEIQILLVNIIAGGVGLTLTRGNTALFVEIDWVPANNFQAIKRLHRITQTTLVNIYTLIASNSLDTYIVKMIKNKTRDIQRTLVE